VNSQEQNTTHFDELQSFMPKSSEELLKKIIDDINFSILTGAAPANIVLPGKKLRMILRSIKVSSTLIVHGCAAIHKATKKFINLLFVKFTFNLIKREIIKRTINNII